MDSHAIVCDLQAPYHSRKAVDVACQILEAAKPDSLTFNGDVGDFRKLGGSKYPQDDGARSGLISELKTECERTGTLVKSIVKAAKAKKLNWTDGNHEYRIWRAMALSPQTMQLMGMDVVRFATNPLTMLGLQDLKFNYAGHYPRGLWLLGEDVHPDQNVWMEHGYIVRQKSGYTASAYYDKRHCNVIVGHVERMAMVWNETIGNKATNGKRTHFAIEGGTLSTIAEPGLGDDIYTGIPHSVPDYMNHQQGFVILNHDKGEWFPEFIRIRNGRAIFRGKLYKA